MGDRFLQKVLRLRCVLMAIKVSTGWLNVLQGQQAQHLVCLTNICAGVLLQLRHPILRFGERLAARDVIHHRCCPRSPAFFYRLSAAELQTLMQAEVISFRIC